MDCCGDAKIVYQLAHDLSGHEQRIPFWIDAIIRDATPKKGLTTIMAALAAGFALLLFVFIKQALRNASGNDESVEKINEIKLAWRKSLGKRT